VITVFTLCSTNYLAHAKTLGDSLRQYNPDYHFVLGIVDRLPAEIEPSFLAPYEVIQVEELGIEGFDEMVQRYDVVELNTAVKPFYFEYLFQRDPATEAIIYLDPDILITASVAQLTKVLQTKDIVVTPHSCTFDNSDRAVYYEQGMLWMGIYNLGFIGLRRSDVATAFLRWWKYRLREHCYRAWGTGMFVDQLWVTLAPLYFPVHVEKNLGYNMCYWNHFERRLFHANGRYLVNNADELVFYHFSSYNPDQPDKITARKKSIIDSFDQRPDLKPLYDDYRDRLLRNGYLNVKAIPFALRDKPAKTHQTPVAALRDGIRGILRSLPSSFQTPLKRIAQFTVNSFKTI